MTNEEACQESVGDKTDDLHTCLLPKGHDGPHRCSEKLCGKAWR